MGDRSASQAVNYRQKLDRLETALAVGPLTRRTAKATQVNEVGHKVAGEVRLLLRELRAIEERPAQNQTWVIGAGDAWLQSVVVPALARIAATGTREIWEVCNLRVGDVCRALREGRLHFGFIRTADIREDDCLVNARVYGGPTYSVLAGAAADAPISPQHLIQWLRKNKRPLVQQGSTWRPLRERIGKRLRAGTLLAGLEPSVICETHPQAVAAAMRGTSWCIVPTSMALFMVSKEMRVAEIGSKDADDDMALVTYARHTDKVPRAKEALDVLKVALGAIMQP
jgi:DNA-binding transcriptional LysR family regulator